MKMTKQALVLLLFGCLLSLDGLASSFVEEGLFLDGVAGVIRKVEDVDVWIFTADADVALSEDAVWPASKSISLLPCSVLEQITTLAGEDNEIHVRLWGLFTEYNYINYLYSVYFLPVQEDKGVKSINPETQEAQKDTEEKTEGPAGQEEESIIPTDILQQIKANKAPDLKKFQQVAVVTGDTNLIGRAGYMEQKGKVKFFRPDAFGQNISRHQYLLLPCNALKAAEKEMPRSPGRERYNVSGLITSYKGRNYILLRRTVRTYTNGNFTP